MTILELIPLLATAAALSLVLTPVVRAFALRFGAVDLPDARKIHSTPTPRLGGIAVCVSVIVTFAAGRLWILTSGASALPDYNWALLGTATAAVVAMGAWDDIRSLSAGLKLCVQIVIAIMVYMSGVAIPVMSVPFGTGFVDLGLASAPATILWIVIVMNAFNLIDGLDGLAAGIAIIVSGTICAISLMSNDYLSAAASLIIAGACLGFLPHNFHPAKIFLGDSGSLLLGFLFSLLTIHSSTKGTSAFPILIPLLALGLPIADTVLSILRRALRCITGGDGKSVSVLGILRATMRPDRKHIHHQLLAKGFSHRAVVGIMYLASGAFGVAALTIERGNIFPLIVLGLAAIPAIRKLGYREMALFENGALLRLFDRRSWASAASGMPWVGGIFALLALAVSFSFTEAGTWGQWGRGGVVASGSDATLFLMLLLCAGVQTVVLWRLHHVHELGVRIVAIGDLLHALKSVFVAVVASGMVVQLWLLSTGWGTEAGAASAEFMSAGGSAAASAASGHDGLPLSFWIIDFYLLATLIIGSRTLYHALKYMFRKAQRGEKRVLIYGANPLGLVTLQNILNFESPTIEPIGFLDEDPSLEGTELNGYPILGGHLKLESTLDRRDVHSIILCENDLPPLVFGQIWAAARSRGVVIRRPRIGMEDVSTNVQRAQPEVLTYAA